MILQMSETVDPLSAIAAYDAWERASAERAERSRELRRTKSRIAIFLATNILRANRERPTLAIEPVPTPEEVPELVSAFEQLSADPAGLAFFAKLDVTDQARTQIYQGLLELMPSQTPAESPDTTLRQP